jgi:uncharacterized membrane protein YesL
MGFFGGMDQPGPGVYIDDPQDGPIVSFFRMYGTKFFSLCLFNLLFVLANIPAILLSCFIGGFLLPSISPALSIDKLTDTLSIILKDSSSDPAAIASVADQLYWLLIILSSFVLTGMLLIVFGPLQGALSYMYRNYARGNSSFYWQDFVKSFKDNWKQSLISSIISIIITLVLMVNIVFYASVYTGSNGTTFAVIFSVLLFFFMCVQMYVYPMIVSLELSLLRIYKNALIFTIVRLFPTIGVVLIQLLVLLVIPLLLVSFASGIGVSITIAFYLTVAFAFAHFLGNFFVWHQIEKYIVAPQQKISEDENTTEGKPSIPEVDINDLSNEDARESADEKK